VKPRRAKAHLIRPIVMLAGVIFCGGAALYYLGHGRWTFWEAVYHTVISASTVGYGEPPGLRETPYARPLIVGIIVSSLGAVAYFQSNLTTFLVEDVIGERLRTRRMFKQVEQLRNHTIVAGAGSTGRHVITELVATRSKFVVIDHDREHLEYLSEELAGGKMLFVVGDATLDPTLVAAGIHRASGVVAALTEDKDNLYVTLSARTLNPKARIVSKVIHPDAAKKMRRAGATSTVSPNMIGGLRMAHELLRPTAVQFLDRMMTAKGQVLRIEEVSIPENSWFSGRLLRELPIRSETQLLVVAVYEDDAFHYNPPPDFEVRTAMTLVVMGEFPNIERLRDMVVESEAPGA
jgi:voltage-gated potassium channel